MSNEKKFHAPYVVVKKTQGEKQARQREVMARMPTPKVTANVEFVKRGKR